MKLKFCSLASGSSGNCYLIKTDDKALLIDAGISGKKIFQGLDNAGVEKEDVCGILVTHEHIDHVRSLPILTKKLPNAVVYANAGTWEAHRAPRGRGKTRHFPYGRGFLHR